MSVKRSLIQAAPGDENVEDGSWANVDPQTLPVRIDKRTNPLKIDRITVKVNLLNLQSELRKLY